MGNEQKDRFGDKLRDLEQAREDKFFAERDRELIAKLKAQKNSPTAVPNPVEAEKTKRSDPGADSSDG